MIVDSSVANYQELIDDLAANDSSELDFAVFILDADQDGIDQISKILSDFSDVDAVHLVSHGSDGRVKLGSTWLDNAGLTARAGEVASWNSSLSVDADLLIYGCELASTDAGRNAGGIFECPHGS